MGSAYTQPLDIWQRALDHCGVARIATVGEDTKQYVLASTIYDKVRQSELRRNQWRFALRRGVVRPIDAGTALWTPAAYNAFGSYSVGDVNVSGGDWWQSQVANNLGNTPGASGTFWKTYFGPDSANPWDYTGKTSYFAGELVIVPAAYAGGTTYGFGEMVNGPDNIFYISQQPGNTGHTPSSNPTWWTPWQATPPSALAPPLYTNTPQIWMSMGSANLSSPITNGAPAWKNMGGTLQDLQILYPIGTGPAADTQTANIYRLPRGYLRRATENPKAGVNLWLGAPGHLWVTDDLYEGNYIVSAMETAQSNAAKMIRFVADMTFVPEMEAMFCEGVAARLALEMNWPLNQSSEREAGIQARYKVEMSEARLVNAVESGPEEPAEDPYITCRR